jgi:hypothetical protein
MRKISAKMILHHDSAPVHDELRVREFLAKNSITKMNHLPYSPDLAPCDFWLFPKLKTVLLNKHKVNVLVVYFPQTAYLCFALLFPSTKH